MRFSGCLALVLALATTSVLAAEPFHYEIKEGLNLNEFLLRH